MKTMEINELVNELKEYDGESDIKVWIRGADKAYPISTVAAGTTCAYIGVDDSNLVDLSKIWHDASEPPKPNKWFIYEAYAEDQDPEYGAYFSAELEPITWGRMTVANEITRWAYISELLPKQLENCKQSKEVLL